MDSMTITVTVKMNRVDASDIIAACEMIAELVAQELDAQHITVTPRDHDERIVIGADVENCDPSTCWTDKR